MLTMLMENAVGERKRNEPKKEMGMPKLTQNASRISRKSARKKNTSPSPIYALRSSRSALWAKILERSLKTVRRIPSGNDSLIRFTTSLPEAATWVGVWSPTR